MSLQFFDVLVTAFLMSMCVGIVQGGVTHVDDSYSDMTNRQPNWVKWRTRLRVIRSHLGHIPLHPYEDIVPIPIVMSAIETVLDLDG